MAIESSDEFYRPPEEFPVPADQIVPPPSEFGSGRESAPSSKKKRKYHWLAAALAAGLLSTIAMFSDTEKALQEPVHSPTPQAVVAAATPTPAPDHTPSPSPLPTAGPTATLAPTPEPTATPEPTPEPALRVEPVFFHCSAIHYGWVDLENQSRVSALHVEVWESGLNILEWSHDLSSSEIASGHFSLPILDGNQLYFQHYDLYTQSGSEPQLELRVTVTVDGPDGREQREITVEPSEEQGWGLNYWPANYTPLWEGQKYYPDCFAVRSYESYDGYPLMRMGSYQDAVETGEICVELYVNGRQVPAEAGYVENYSEPIYRYDVTGALVETGNYLYYTVVVIPRPTDEPISGTAQFRIYQKLNGYDKIWVMAASNEYGPAD